MRDERFTHGNIKAESTGNNMLSVRRHALQETRGDTTGQLSWQTRVAQTALYFKFSETLSQPTGGNGPIPAVLRSRSPGFLGPV